MKRTILKYMAAGIVITTIASSCLKSNPYYEDFSSITPMADIPKATVNAVAASAPTTSWVSLDSLPGGFDYLTAVHLSAPDHVGDVTVRMVIDKAAANTWITNHPTAGYTLIPDSLFSVPSLDVKISNAGVFSTGDFHVTIKSGVRDPATGTVLVPKGTSIFKTYKFILPISIESVPGTNYGIAANYKTVLWYIKVK
ncbi:MAG: DUF1735 domain-containing protein [Ferruginibacter sp.]